MFLLAIKTLVVSVCANAHECEGEVRVRCNGMVLSLMGVISALFSLASSNMAALQGRWSFNWPNHFEQANSHAKRGWGSARAKGEGRATRINILYEHKFLSRLLWRQQLHHVMDHVQKMKTLTQCAAIYHFSVDFTHLEMICMGTGGRGEDYRNWETWGLHHKSQER